jgi:hypothetical protein
MSTPKRPIALAAVDLEVGPSEFVTPDLTELRSLVRPFPKDESERGCYRYLLEQMLAALDRPHRTKSEVEKTCRRRFHVTVESFDYCWREGVKVTGARWDRPGRRAG